MCGAGHVFGKEIITLNLLKEFRQRGHEVECLTSVWADPEFIRRLEAERIPFARLPMGYISTKPSWANLSMNFGQLVHLPGLWMGYRRNLREFKPDAVVQTNLHHTLALWPALDPRNTFFHVHEPFPATKFYRRLFRFLNRRLSSFIGVSQFIGKSVVALGVPEVKTFSVLNGLAVEDEAGCAGKICAANLRAVESEDSGPLRLSIIGQIGAWKGHDDLIEALSELKKEGVEFTCRIYGKGDAGYIESLKKRIADDGLDEMIEWGGFVPDAREIFRATDVCVVPSRSEDPCPTVAIEAAHYGVPVVATRRGGLPEIVSDGETGFLVDAESPLQLCEKLKALLLDAKLRERMGARARTFARERLNQERMVNEMEATLKRVLLTKGSNR